MPAIPITGTTVIAITNCSWQVISCLKRATVDAGLSRILQGDAKARLMRMDDPRTITPADIEAAFNPAGDPFHILWIFE
jgi:hypothetical protein